MTVAAAVSLREAKRPLVIVESPTKAKTLKKFLPKHFSIIACNGHVRDLPQSANDIPARYKKEPWSRIGVDVEHDFKPLYIVPKNKTKVIKEITQLIDHADYVLLATDEDREGESISWHLLELLKPEVPYTRMVFHEITKPAIERALGETRALDLQLVKAQETRRVLDRLVGYSLSPLLWTKIAFGLSAGRVQSVAVKLLVAREQERMSFVSAQYQSIDARLEIAKNTQTIEAKLTAYQGRRIATGKDFDESTGTLKADPHKVLLLTPPVTSTLLAALKTAPFIVQHIEEKNHKRYPAAPFITSTLQQEANRKLGFSARDTMRVAQSLYERGLITYMRTDSTTLSREALSAARRAIEHKYGAAYLSDAPRQYASKSKNAQEAHEAIRPAGVEFVSPEDTGLHDRDLALYDLIWKRTMASQMKESEQLRTTVTIQANEALFNVTGLRIVFAGFLRAYVEGSDDPQAALDEQETLLPELRTGQTLYLKDLLSHTHETKPPARYTEASLVQRMEKEGIGRPSTYAATIGTIIDRGYVSKIGNALLPTLTAFAVTALLERYFHDLVDLGFTAQMEQALDEIAEGSCAHLPYLRSFYLGDTGLLNQVEHLGKQIDTKTARTVHLPQLEPLHVEVKIGKFGPYFVKYQDNGEPLAHGSIPAHVSPADLNAELIESLIKNAQSGPHVLGEDPESHEKIYLMSGRFGPYIQRGMPKLEENTDTDNTDAAPQAKKGQKEKGKKAKKSTARAVKPKQVSLPKGVTPEQVTLTMALQLLALPRTLGTHPGTALPVQAGIGRFGPYIVHQGEFRSLKAGDDVLTIQLDRALDILAQPKNARQKKVAVLKDLGQDPKSGAAVQILNGRFGAYVSNGKQHASLKSKEEQDTLTLEAALARLQEAAQLKSKTRSKKTRTKTQRAVENTES